MIFGLDVSSTMCKESQQKMSQAELGRKVWVWVSFQGNLHRGEILVNSRMIADHTATWCTGSKDREIGGSRDKGAG